MGSARVPRVGCGVSLQQSSSRRREVVAALKKFAMAGRDRHHASTNPNGRQLWSEWLKSGAQ